MINSDIEKHDKSQQNATKQQEPTMTDTVLNLIDLDQNREGYREFISCWALRGNGLTCVVDPGPLSTAEHLIAHLRQIGIKTIDYILLTHIHLDHGGGAHEVMRAFPTSRVYCHKIGRKHLVDPGKLWKGSLHVLGEVAHMYGKPEPLENDKIADSNEIKSRGIRPIPTPGHAPHHVAFVVDDILFAGEAIGTRLDLPSGEPYLRPATPPKFSLEDAIYSLNTLLSLAKEPKYTAFAHYGSVRDGFRWCKRGKRQLNLWVQTIEELCAESMDDLEERLFRRLMDTDPLYGQGRFDEMAEDLKKRERHFLGNTLDGMLGYLESKNRQTGSSPP